jgi:hypothetical protein
LIRLGTHAILAVQTFSQTFVTQNVSLDVVMMAASSAIVTNFRSGFMTMDQIFATAFATATGDNDGVGIFDIQSQIDQSTGMAQVDGIAYDTHYPTISVSFGPQSQSVLINFKEKGIDS